MICPMVPFPLTLSDPQRRFQGHGDALDELCAQLTRDLLVIAMFLLNFEHDLQRADCSLNNHHNSAHFPLTLQFATSLVLHATLCTARPMPSCGICPSVCLSRSFFVSKRINIFLKFFYQLVDHRSGFSAPNVIAIFRRTP